MPDYPTDNNFDSRTSSWTPSNKGDHDAAFAEYRTAIGQQPNYLQAQSALDNALAAKAKSGS